MRPGRASQKRFQDMLLDEARMVARIQHPNVTQIWEVGEDPRSLYVVMELVEGDSLDELRYRAEEAGKTLSVRAIFRVLADVCAGLHVAHELSQDGRPLGLVHRDISPQNILVSRDGIAKLIDFGIAKAKERLAADTTTGYIKGKISFMAPEQARTEDMDRRADLWAIGAVAYDLIEGRPPCDGQSDLGRLAALVGPTPVQPLSPRVPEPLRAVVARTLKKNRDERFDTALELKEAIEAALIESELETSPTEVAELFAPHFHTVAPRSAPPTGDPSSDTKAHSVERAVSSTIRAREPSASIELPLHRRRHWPLAIGALAIVVPLGLWATSRFGEPPHTLTETSGQAGPSATTPPATSASASPSAGSSLGAGASLGAPAPTPASASAKVVATPAASAPGTASSVQGVHKTKTPASSVTSPQPPNDDYAIE